MPSKAFETVGTKQELSNRPVASPSANPKSGAFQTVGDAIPLSRKSIQSPSANPKSGTFQMVGTDVPLSRKPIKEWNSLDKLPYSERAIQQSNTAAGGKGKKK